VTIQDVIPVSASAIESLWLVQGYQTRLQYLRGLKIKRASVERAEIDRIGNGNRFLVKLIELGQAEWR